MKWSSTEPLGLGECRARNQFEVIQVSKLAGFSARSLTRKLRLMNTRILSVRDKSLDRKMLTRKFRPFLERIDCIKPLKIKINLTNVN